MRSWIEEERETVPREPWRERRSISLPLELANEADDDEGKQQCTQVPVFDNEDFEH
jgi:hypothetical protein